MDRNIDNNVDNNIIQTEYSELMQKSYIDYAMSVIIARALPRHKNLVLCLLDCLITCKNQCRKDSYTSDNSEYNALCHYDSQVKSKCKAHEAEGYEACDCCD